MCQINVSNKYHTNTYFIDSTIKHRHRQASFKAKGDKLSPFAEYRIQNWAVWDTKSPADWMPTHKPTELPRIKHKTWIQQPVPVMREHSAHLTSLPIGFPTWRWWYAKVPCSAGGNNVYIWLETVNLKPDTFSYCYSTVNYNTILHDAATRKVNQDSDHELITDTPYLASIVSYVVYILSIWRKVIVLCCVL